MRDQQPSRSKRVLDAGQMGVQSLIREPVKQSVREALAEEGSLAETRAEHARQSADAAESDRDEAEDESDDGSRSLRPLVVLPVLGVAAAVALAKRRQLMAAAEERGVIDRTGGTDSTQEPDHGSTDDSATADQTTEDSGSTDTKYSTSADAYNGDTEREDLTERADGDHDGPMSHGDHDGDTDSEEVSTTD